MGLDQTATAAPYASEVLVARIRAGNTEAEDCLVSAYSRGIFLIAVARTRDREAARDLTQEVLIAVLKALREGQLRSPDKLAAFIQGVTRNVVNNYLRESARHPEEQFERAEAIIPVNVEDELEAAERQRLLRKELQTLDRVDQQILLLSLVEGQSMSEIAERLNMSHDAVRARKSRAVKKIAKKFAVAVTAAPADTTY
jgi:RNA polymerase sigma factor (sigma-70 family)